MRSAPVFLPALLRFPEERSRMDSWARLLELTTGGADVSTPVRLERGETVFVTFELGAQSFGELKARVVHAEDDADGRRLAELRWLDEVQRRRVARALTEVLAGS